MKKIQEELQILGVGDQHPNSDTVNSIINIVYIGVHKLFRHNMLNIIDEN